MLFLKIGEEGRLYINADSEEILVAVDKETLSDLTATSVTNDDYGFAQILFEGGAYIVEPNTKVLVLDYTFTTVKFRILEGPHENRIGWTASEWVVKA